MDTPVWYVLFASLVGEAVAIILATWAIIWLLVAIPRLRGRKRLDGSYRAAWDVALPIGGLISIVVVGRALLEWMVR
jgi:hypothetical protein